MASKNCATGTLIELQDRNFVRRLSSSHDGWLATLLMAVVCFVGGQTMWIKSSITEHLCACRSSVAVRLPSGTISGICRRWRVTTVMVGAGRWIWSRRFAVRPSNDFWIAVGNMRDCTYLCGRLNGAESTHTHTHCKRTPFFSPSLNRK